MKPMNRVASTGSIDNALRARVLAEASRRVEALFEKMARPAPRTLSLKEVRERVLRELDHDNED